MTAPHRPREDRSGLKSPFSWRWRPDEPVSLTIQGYGNNHVWLEKQEVPPWSWLGGQTGSVNA